MAGAGAAPPTDRLNATPMLSLVTGASGFVGQAIVRRLLADGHVVRALVLPGDRRLPELRALGAADRLAIIEADTTSYDAPVTSESIGVAWSRSVGGAAPAPAIATPSAPGRSNAPA